MPMNRQEDPARSLSDEQPAEREELRSTGLSILLDWALTDLSGRWWRPGIDPGSRRRTVAGDERIELLPL